MCEFPERNTTTTSSSGGGARVIGVFLLAMIAASALSSVLGLVWIALGIGLIALVAGSVVLVLWHLHRHLSGLRVPVREVGERYVPQMHAHRQPWQVPAAQPRAVDGGQHLHLHLGDLTPAERDAALRQLRGGL